MIRNPTITLYSQVNVIQYLLSSHQEGKYTTRICLKLADTYHNRSPLKFTYGLSRVMTLRAISCLLVRDPKLNTWFQAT